MGTSQVGIDFGTSYSSIAVCIEGKLRVVPDESGALVHASVVHFPRDGPPVVGERAPPFLASDPENTIASIKRLLGHKYDSEAGRIARASSAVDISEAPNGYPIVSAHGQVYSVPQICALVLGHLTQIAERTIGDPIESAVVTVPANAGDRQREATRDACRIAGFEATRLLNEPTAAALTCGIAPGAAETIAVYDFGGGTFDISLLEVRAKVFEVLATAGESFLGGDDFDLAIAEQGAKQFLARTGVDLHHRTYQWQRLLFQCERAKRELAIRSEAQVVLEEAAHLADGPSHLELSIRREDLERFAAPLLERSFETCDRALGDAQIDRTMVDSLVLVGGTTLLPFVRAAAERYFGRPARKGPSSMLAVTLGAALYAAELSGEPALHLDRARALLLDVTARTIGIGVAGGAVEPVIRRGAVIPTEHSREFATSTDGQTTIRIRIYEGESGRMESDTFLGEFVVSSLPSALRGEVCIDVGFEIDANGILHVTARDATSGRPLAESLNFDTELTKHRG